MKAILKRLIKLMNIKNLKDNLKSIFASLFLIKPRRNSFVAKIVRLLSECKEPEKWIFIVGCYNSGTTLLMKLLENYNDQISILNEGASKTDILKMPEEFGWKRMWYKVIDEVKVNGNQSDVKKLKKDWNFFLDKKKRFFLEKSIVNILNMEWLQKYFPNSYFIGIIRNGYAVAEGIKRKCKISGLQWGIINYPIELCAKQWVISNEILEEASKKIKNFKLIFYEDLCKDPKKIIDEIYNFIGILRKFKWNKNIKWEIQEKNSIIKNMNELSIKNLSKLDIIKIENVAEKMLKKYNYEILSKKNVN
ncbi:MAG: sulfotransferase family protein [Candidatus Helarchaeota archaeon]